MTTASAAARTAQGVKSPVPFRFGPNGLALIESHHAEEFVMTWRREDYHKLLLVVGGRGRLHLTNRTHELRAPALMAVPSRVRHRLSDSPGHPMSILGLVVGRLRFPAPTLVASAFGAVRVESEPRVMKRFVQTFQEILHEERTGSPESSDAQLMLFTRLMIDWVRTRAYGAAGPPDARQRVAAARRVLETGFWREWDLDQAACEAGLSRRRFTQLFREATGTTWLGELQGLRLTHAAKLLAGTGLSVQAIAFECGFQDISHFYRLFRSRFQASPIEFRRNPQVVAPLARES